MSYKDLNESQRLIVDRYVEGAISMADAVIEAGHAPAEGIEAHDVALRLLASPKIIAAIKERAQVLHDQGSADAFWLLRHLVDYANVEYTDMFKKDGTPIPPKRWPLALRRMVRKLKLDPVTGGVVEVAFEPKTKVLELIGRTDLVGSFEHEHQSNETLVIVRDMTKQIEEKNEKEVGQVVETEARRIE